MRSARSGSSEPGGAASRPAAEADLTARTRIRDAAVLHFGTHGFAAGVRAIAAEAGVSPALVLHHFGSKHGLREECDRHVLAVIRAQKSAVVGPAGPQHVLLSLASVDELAPLVGYTLRSLQAGGELALRFVEHVAADAEEYLAEGVAAGTILPSADEAARARYLTVQSLGTLLLDLSLHPPEDPGDVVALVHGYLDRTGGPSLELFTQGLLADRSMLDAYQGYAAEPPEAAPRGDPAPPS
ncbi:TetR family transcriptional regulator [Cellulomonas sp. NPDC055163]